jgi:hypothetical protein
VLFETFIAVLRPLANQRCGAIALVSNDTLSLGGAVALLDHVASVEAKDPEAWPSDLVDDDGERRTWHYFLIANLSDCLRELMAGVA